MKANGEIARLLETAVRNEEDYKTRVVHKILTALGVPDGARWPQFRIRNPGGPGPWKPDLVLLTETGLPMVVIEAKPRAHQYGEALREAQAYARNFEPIESDVRRMTPPFVIAAAGSSFRMLRGRTHGLEILYEEIRIGNRPAFLEWNEILEEANSFARPDARVTSGIGVVALARQFFEDVHGALYAARALRSGDDERIRVLCGVIEAARGGGAPSARKFAIGRRLGQSVARRLQRAIDPYDASVRSGLLTGSDAALAFREFITSDSRRRGLKLFTGESQSRPVRRGTRIVYRRTARYFTPTDVIRQLVRLPNVRPTDRVLDLACGSGGFLGQVLHHVADEHPESVESFATERLVGVDDDPFCVEATRAYLSLFRPDLRDRWRVFLHNALYASAPKKGDLEEDRQAEAFLQPGTYDVVLSNPPGNREYSGSNGNFVKNLWRRRYGSLRRPWDHVFFVRRAIELTRPDGGRVCILVPDGFLSNEHFQDLRDELFSGFAIRAVISLPRVFRNNDAKMSILFGVRGERSPSDSVCFAEVRERAVDGREGEQDLVLFSELEAVVDEVLRASAAGAPTSPQAEGTRAVG